MSAENFVPGPYFGDFGGRFVAESLMGPLEEVEAAWKRLWRDKSFQARLRDLFANYAGRPSLLTEAPRFAADLGGVRVFLKREDLNHTGSHKINNVLGQALLTKELGKTRVIAETEPASTASPPRPRRPSSAWTARSTWGARTRSVRPSTLRACRCSAPR